MSVDRQTYGQTLIAMPRAPTGAWRRAPADWVEVVNYLDHCCQHKACGEHEARRYQPISGAWAAAKLLLRLLLRSGAGGRYGSKSGRYPRLSTGQTDGRTDTLSLRKPCTAYDAGSVHNAVI